MTDDSDPPPGVPVYFDGRVVGMATFGPGLTIAKLEIDDDAARRHIRRARFQPLSVGYTSRTDDPEEHDR